MKKYNPLKIERKQQKKWDIFKAKDGSKKPKFYVLVEFPYPSGEGLHVGHARSYIALDIVARKKRMENFNVLFPIGWDAFGLPTENYAVKTGIHPKKATKKNTDNYRRQLKKLGLSFDWSREINTTDSDYYKWTQWIFIQLFKKGMAYKDRILINWCPFCKIGLANEEVVNDKCERCEKKVVKKEKEQWMLRITRYADRLIKDLDLVDYPERVKISQKEWIGKSRGLEIKFQVNKSNIPVFTTRPDTLFGCNYLVLAPEHSLIKELEGQITNFKAVKEYIEESKARMERERISKEKNGIELKGIKAVNPVNGRKIPIFVADYVLMHYGSGAIMAVPDHDQRDFEFAKKYNLAIIEVIKSDIKRDYNSAYEGEGVLINSDRFDGMKSKDAKERISQWLIKKGLARKSINYKLRDWVFSRQRYWGEPIPMIKCEKCGWSPVEEKDLPVELPRVKEYKPTNKGESPLAQAKTWLNVKCPKCKGPGQRETDVMPNWAGSNWYFLRYCDPKNNKKLADLKKLSYWMPVDWYNGGMEHTTLHLLYSRFIYKFLWDIGAVSKDIEPYKKRTSHGMILGQGGIKMSKSKNNVINPEEVIEEYGADTLRVYEMFMGPFEQAIPWDTKGVKGVRRFLEKVWKIKDKAGKTDKLEGLVHKTINKVSKDIEQLKFNTAVSSLMVLANEMEKQEVSSKHYSLLLILLNPFAPYITEEIWQELGLKGNCFSQKWPKYDSKLIKEKTITLIVQINGKIRDRIEIEAGVSEKDAKKNALASEKVKKWIGSKNIKKVIFIKDKIINFVI